MLRSSLALGLLLAPLAFGCGSTTTANGNADATVDSAFTPISDAGTCGVTTRKVDTGAAIHVEQGSILPFASNPPCGGDHYPIWSTWGSHETPVPRGNWIHNLEHGGVALLYRCESRSKCPEIAQKLEALAKALPQDPVCSAEMPPIRNRIIITPDPELPVGVEVAAAAWGFNLVARCFDEALFRDFYLSRFGRATENFCADGSAIPTPIDAGASDGSPDTDLADATADGG